MLLAETSTENVEWRELISHQWYVYGYNSAKPGT